MGRPIRVTILVPVGIIMPEKMKFIILHGTRLAATLL